MVWVGKAAWRSGLSDLAMAAAARGAAWMLQVAPVRDFFLDRLLRWLEDSYDDCDLDDGQLTYDRWLGRCLRPFLDRLVRERPAAAKAILRFIASWIQDMHRRTAFERGGLPHPCTVVIEPTDRCNLSCPGCYAKSTCQGSDLPFESLARIVQQVVDMGVTLVTISGGEPFLREQADRTLTRLAQRFPDRGFLVYTNGTLIDEVAAENLSQAGNVFPAISVEGSEHHTDARRGEGIYRQARRARELLAQRGVMCGFSATVTRRNAEAICADEFIERRIEEGDLFGWFFLLQPIGRSPRPDLMVTSEQRALLRRTVYRWRQERRPIFLGDFWNDGHLVGGCIAGGRYYFHIRANGDISPCTFSPIACGNVLDILEGRSPYASLQEFVRDNPVFRAFRREQERITDRSRPCLLMDNPDAFRRVAAAGGCRPARNMPPGYLDGNIASTIDAVAAAWQARVAAEPPLPPAQEQEAQVPAGGRPQGRSSAASMAKMS